MRACALTLCLATPLVGAVVKAGASTRADSEQGAVAVGEFRLTPVRVVDFAAGATEVLSDGIVSWYDDEPTLTGIPLGPSMAYVTPPLLVLNDDVRAHPLAFSVAITGVKAGLADLLVQLNTREPTLERSRLNYRRLATFVLTGAVYQGLFQYWLFNVVLPTLLPGHSLRATLQKVLAANLIADPVFFFPFFYILHEALACSPGQVFRMSTVSSALGKYYANCLYDWRNSWSIWLPGHAITYGVMPPHLRMPWIAAVSFGYIALLSVTRGSRPTQKPSKPTGA